MKKLIEFQKRARAPNEISSQAATKLLEYLIYSGKMAPLLSSEEAPYDSYTKTDLQHFSIS